MKVYVERLYRFQKLTPSWKRLETSSTVFSKLHANSGFCQEKLAEKFQLLTTFLTTFGSYCFQRLPFGLKSAPERFQRRMLTELDGLDSVICIMDDILVHGKTQTELARLTNAKLTLNFPSTNWSLPAITASVQTQTKQQLLRKWDVQEMFQSYGDFLVWSTTNRSS